MTNTAYLVPQAHSYSLETRTNNISAQGSMQAFGVVDSTGAPVAEARHFRGKRCLTDETRLVERFKSYDSFTDLPGRWFYGGIMYPHFGHFLTETVHRLSDYLDDPEAYDGILFLKSPRQGTFDYDPLAPAYVQDVFCKFFGLDPKAIKLITEPTRVEHLDCVEQHQQLGGQADAPYLAKLGALEAAYLEAHRTKDTPTYKRAFLSRHNYLRSGRALGMRAIEDVFTQNDFTIVHPETLSFGDQLSIVSASEHLVVEAGSALHLLDILGPQKDLDLLVLSRRGRDNGYWKNLCFGRVPVVHVFDNVFPIHDYIGGTAGEGYSLIHPREICVFLKRLGLEFSEKALVENLREATFDDLRSLNKCMPN